MDERRSSTYPDRDNALLRSPRRVVGLLGIALLCVVGPGCDQFDTSRDIPDRGSAGEEVYGLVCDRVGAQALNDDLSGASFRDVCHRPAGGKFADKVDRSQLPALDPDAVDGHGKMVPLEKQKADRDRGIGRIEALGRRRDDLIRALDASFPAKKVQVKELDADDPAHSCDTSKNSQELLTHALADTLGRAGALYDDGTIPQATESLSRVVDALDKDEPAREAWARLAGRSGYRPLETALGALRPVVAYPRLRDFANASLRLLSADSQPYDPAPARDAEGQRILVAGPGNAALNKLLEAGHAELLTATATPNPGPLVATPDPSTTRVLLSRPRDNLEIAQALLLTEDDAFADGDARFIVRRDDRGYARLRGGALPAPFVDTDNDGMPDVDPFGHFVTSNRSIVPAPFFVPNETGGAVRDPFGRASVSDGLLYDYVDTSRSFAAQALRDLRPLVNPDPNAKHETLIDLVGGLKIAMGPRETRTKDYGQNVQVAYDGVRTKESPALDLVYALGTILGDRSADATLAMLRELFTSQIQPTARMTGAVSAAWDIAQKHAEAKLPVNSVFWDDVLDTLAKIAQEPGLLEDVLRGFAAPETQGLGNSLSRFAQLKDEVSYDPNDLNGFPLDVTTQAKAEMSTPVDRNQPQTGQNRSALYRFVSLIVDTSGVTACNKPGAKVDAFGLSLPGSFQECEVFKIENLAAFYLDSIANAQQYDTDVAVPRGTIYMRPTLLRLAPGISTVLESSSGINGFWDASGNVAAPKPNFLNRLVFFDVDGDTQNSRTKSFISDLQGEHFGTSVCPERVIQDPSPDAVDASPDGMVHGLRNCPDGQWLQQRAKNTIFVWEEFGFYDAVRPILGAFVRHKREDLFLELTTAIFKHYGDAAASDSECLLANGQKCGKDGLVTYEPLLGEALVGDVVPALGALAKALDTLPIQRCDAVDPTSHACTQPSSVTGIDVAAQAARAALDPGYSQALGLTDRQGNPTAKRNDGTPVPQVTPAYLLTNALHAIDLAFDKYEQQNPSDKERRAGWRRARSQLVDQFLGTTGVESNAAFTDPTVPKMGPVILDTLRSQLLAHCPTSFAPPYDACTWARTDLTQKAEDSLAGPLATTGIDVLDAIRSDPDGRRETEALLTYLLDAASGNDALASVLASSADLVQLLHDDANLVPLYKVLAAAMDATKYDDHGKVVQKSLVDAQMSLLARLGGKYVDGSGKEICANEVDPNQVLTTLLANVVTPIKDAPFGGRTPLDVILDVIADVNRADPTTPYSGALGKDDYGSIGANVFDFLTNKERGLEQFYEVIRQGTKF